jgi:hypothetical protein
VRDYAAAIESFTSCRDAMLLIGRNHDAALACLFLAEAYFLAERSSELFHLARQLVPVLLLPRIVVGRADF